MLFATHVSYIDRIMLNMRHSHVWNCHPWCIGGLKAPLNRVHDSEGMQCTLHISGPSFSDQSYNWH